MAGFSSEALRVKENGKIFQVLKKPASPEFLCPTKFFFKYEYEIKSLFCKQKGAYYMIPRVCVYVYI